MNFDNEWGVHYVDLGKPSDFDFIQGNPDMTISAWVNSRNLEKWDGIISNAMWGKCWRTEIFIRIL